MYGSRPTAVVTGSVGTRPCSQARYSPNARAAAAAGAANRPAMRCRQHGVQFLRERSQPRLDALDGRQRELCEGLPRVIQVRACLLQHARDVRQPGNDGIRARGGERRRRQQQIEDRAERLLDVELRIAAPRGGQVELPAHARDR